MPSGYGVRVGIAEHCWPPNRDIAVHASHDQDLARVGLAEGINNQVSGKFFGPSSPGADYQVVPDSGKDPVVIDLRAHFRLVPYRVPDRQGCPRQIWQLSRKSGGLRG